jgi:chromosome segregation ATPase
MIMNTQEALVEVEKLVRTWKAVERIKDVLDTVASADNYVKELVSSRDSLVSEVATIKSQIEVAQAALEVEKEQAGKITSDAKKEAKEIKDKAIAVAKDKQEKAEKQYADMVKEQEDKIVHLKEQVVAYQSQKDSLTKEVAAIEIKYQGIKSELAKLLGK